MKLLIIILTLILPRQLYSQNVVVEDGFMLTYENGILTAVDQDPSAHTTSTEARISSGSISLGFDIYQGFEFGRSIEIINPASFPVSNVFTVTST